MKTDKEYVEEFEDQFVEVIKNINGGVAYKEWKYQGDAEEAIDWLLTTLKAVREYEAKEAYAQGWNEGQEALQEEFNAELPRLVMQYINDNKHYNY